ncbi:MAG: flagellar hook-associated protein FlgL [Sutterellaceae bacterium]|nr:flagellar hook-associated protein FlgL [Burkholderiaceae bacterium]MCX7901892.1 flagellar hook-associated protein FlgL [Burkholderiaceae bacterium]MDW8429983.1 flagellar hook-associated protein FlgL [Sutterellaceae bacterium]
MQRISTFQMFRSGELALVARQRELLETQARIASGKRIAAPADDPIGAADATATRAALARFEQFKKNQDHARYLLNLGESTLASFIGALQDVREKLVAAGNGAYSNAERKMLAGELRGLFDRLVGLANASDGAGGYLFAGSRETAPPFAHSGLSTSFNGDDTLLHLEVASDRFLRVKLSGDALFLKMRPGNGIFITAAAPTNTGTGVIDAGAVVDPTALTGSAYTITFTVSGGATSYQVVRVSDNAVVASGSYHSPAAIEFDGQRVTITGSPANGDSFSTAPAPYRSVFDTVAAAIVALDAGASSPSAEAQLRTALNSIQASLEQALDHLLIKRAEVGAGLAELDGYERLNDDRQLEYRARLSRVEDLDLAAGLSELSRRQTTLEAAIRSYSAVSRLSLFDFLG